MSIAADSTHKDHLRQAVITAANTTIKPIWTKSVLLTLSNPRLFLSKLRHQLRLPSDRLFSDISAQTALEKSDGNWDRVINPLASRCGTNITKMTAAFNTYIQPSFQACTTRKQSWRSWCSVLTWAAGRNALHLIIPMTLKTLKAMIWDMMSMLATHSVLKNIIDSVQSRHRRFHLEPPLSGPHSYTRFLKTLVTVQGKQQKLSYPIQKYMIHKLLTHKHTSLTEFRNCLATVSSTIGMFRPDTGSSLQSCDVLFNDDAKLGFLKFKGGATINVSHSKSDQIRKGHQIRFGRSKNPNKDLVYQLGLWMDIAKLRPRLGCTKETRKHARCPVCPPLFPKLQFGKSGQLTATANKMSASSFADMIPAALRCIGLNSSGYTGKSAKIGGMSIATEAHVPENIIWLQSGHTRKSSTPARGYIQLTDVSLLYKPFEAFGL
jgi:hypothetical protein